MRLHTLGKWSYAKMQTINLELKQRVKYHTTCQILGQVRQLRAAVEPN